MRSAPLCPPDQMGVILPIYLPLRRLPRHERAEVLTSYVGAPPQLKYPNPPRRRVSTDGKDIEDLKDKVYSLENHTGALEDYIVKMRMQEWDKTNSYSEPGDETKKKARDDYEQSVRDEISRLQRVRMGLISDCS